MRTLSRLEGKPRVGISSCLLGQPVRYDGGHKREPSLIDALQPFVEWVPVCPELDIGLGVPRPPIDLVDTNDGIRLIEPSTGRDLTLAMREYAHRKVAQLRSLDLSGYILKAKSPSCGLGSARVLAREGSVAQRDGTGVFAAVLREHMPALPVAEETALGDSRARQAFLERIRTYHRRDRL